MPIGSQNKSIVKTLLETVKVKVEPPKLYDLLRKMDDDLNSVYETLFEGPLPRVVGSALDLTLMPKSNLPASIAYVDLANTFQLVQTLYSDLQLQTFDPTTLAVGDKFTRVQNPVDGNGFFSNNLLSDGAGTFVTDTGDGSGIEFADDIITLRQQIAAVDYTPLIIGHDRIIQIGEPSDISNAVAGDIVLGSELIIWGVDSSGSNTLLMMQLDGNDLVELGSNPTGATTGEGNISISRAVAADLPTAGATRNGILILNKDANKLCYYVSGNRYALTGVAF